MLQYIQKIQNGLDLWMQLCAKLAHIEDKSIPINAETIFFAGH